MKPVFSGTVLAVGILLMGFTAGAVIPERYQTIPDRNAFGLNPPAPVDTNAPAATPPVDVKVTGFGVIGGEKRVYLTIPSKDAKTPQQYLNMSEGQREGSLEVVSISETEGEVRVRNSGIDTVLSLKNNGFQPARVAPGVQIAQPVPQMPAPGAAPSAIYNPANASSVVAPIGNAPSQPPPVPGPPIPGQPPQVNPAGTSPEGLRSIPTRTLRVQPQPQPQNLSEP